MHHNPAGIPHGPHPGTVEASIGKEKTDELAVMVDTFRPLELLDPALLRPGRFDREIVVGVPDPRWGETVYAVVFGRVQVAPDELVAHCRKRIAGFTEGSPCRSCGRGRRSSSRA